MYGGNGCAPRVIAHQSHSVANEVIEIKGVVLLQPCLIGVDDLSHASVTRVLRRDGVLQQILALADEVGDLADRIEFATETRPPQELVEDVTLIVLIQNGEVRGNVDTAPNRRSMRTAVA